VREDGKLVREDGILVRGDGKSVREDGKLVREDGELVREDGESMVKMLTRGHEPSNLNLLAPSTFGTLAGRAAVARMADHVIIATQPVPNAAEWNLLPKIFVEINHGGDSRFHPVHTGIKPACLFLYCR